MRPFISICIPTYKRISYLPKLLDSIIMQNFKDYDVVITDNSDTDVVESLVNTYRSKLPILYHRNIPALNMTENWNKGIDIANGEWIKLIHDDDWFADENALAELVKATEEGGRFIFSGYNAVFEEDGRVVPKTINQTQFSKIQEHPFRLIADNIIGNPSVFMFHSSVSDRFETFMNWYVDIEYYIRMMLKEKAIYIDKPLVNMSYNVTQVTNAAARNPAIVIPEALFIMNTYGNKPVAEIVVYDAWWRLFRNLGIKNETVIKQYEKQLPIPEFIHKMIQHQQMIPGKLLHKGYISKPAMMLSYLLNARNYN